MRWLGLFLCLGVLGVAASCGKQTDGDVPDMAVPNRGEALKGSAATRAKRRAFDGAPPVIAHKDFRMACTNCHKPKGMEVPGVGFAPNMPHGETTGLSAVARCVQCHVFKTTDKKFRQSSFAGLKQDLRTGKRHHPLAPPVMPHALFMRENCQACHTGPAAREEIRCDHPERTRCTQCHLARRTTTEFTR